MEKFKYKEMLESCPMNYIYGKVKKTKEGREIILIEDSNLKFLVGKYIHDVINKIYINNYELKEFYLKCIGNALNLGTYLGENLKIKRKYDYIVFWFNKNFEDISCEDFFYKTFKDLYFYKSNDVKGKVITRHSLITTYDYENYEKNHKARIKRNTFYKKASKKIVEKNDAVFFEVLNYLDDVVVIKEKEKTIYVNDAFEKLYGINCKELYKEKSMLVKADMIHPDDRFKFENIDFKNFFSAKARIIRRDNEIRTVWFRSNSIKDEFENVIRRIIIINDITDNLKEEKEMEKLRMGFFANISHEFKTPVNLIFSVFQMLEFKLKKNLNSYENDYKQYVDTGKQNIFRLLKLINNLIDSIKLEARFFGCNIKNHNIISCVEEVTLSLCDFAKENKVNIIFDTEEEEKIIAFDLEQIERVILNLLSNSIKFNKVDGNIFVYISSDNEYVNISIKDTGIGIPKDEIETLFDRFKIINNRFTKVNEGSGIGLFIVKELVDIHKGKITVKSDLGEGTEFIVSLPLTKIKEDFYEEIAVTYYNNKKDRFKIELSDIYTI